MNDLQKYIHISKYARYLDAEKRRETWEETVDRYIQFLYDKIPNSAVVMELKKAIISMDIAPSMRALMTAGPALERDNVSGFNPVVGTTKVLTKEFGYLPISALEDKEATVLNVNSKWTKAKFKCYGKQSIREVVLKKNSNTMHTMYCTGNHRWVDVDGNVLSTDQLKPGKGGTKIPFASYKRNVDTDSIDYKLGCVHGIVFGDGTTQYSQKRVKGYMIRVCEDQEEFSKYFEFLPEVRISYPPSANGDPVIKLFSDFAKTHDLKDLPDYDNETEDYMVGFFRGWLAADCHVGKNSHVSLCLSEEYANWFLKHSARWGYVAQNVRELGSKTNFGTRTRRTFTISIDRTSLTSEDFLIKRKRDKFIPLISKFCIDSVKELEIQEEVFCAEVPDTNTFVLERGLVTGNCAAIAINHPRCFDEIMYLLSCGCGVGFSVERQYINQLPDLPEELNESETVIKVKDSKIGWASAYKELISMLYSGNIPKWNLDAIRPAGSRLRTFGGRASGPEPLNALMSFTVRTFRVAVKENKRKLNSLEVHDVCCKIADAIVAGGVRRSACLSLSNLTDDRMRRSKVGDWYSVAPYRALANNSVAYTEKPDLDSFSKEWRNLYISKSGERGIVNKEALKAKAESCGREYKGDYLLNPCGEAILRDSGGLCNLTEIIVRPEDTLETLKEKVRLATILGTLQSTLTNFRYLRKVWKDNAEEERLLGVSLTGIMDHPVMSGHQRLWSVENPEDPGHMAEYTLEEVLKELREVAYATNKEWASKLGISPSKQLTLVKPSGTVSQLVSSSSGIHPRYARYYIRRVTQDSKDSLTGFLVDQGVPYVVSGDKYIFSFYVAAPDNCVTTRGMSAMEQLELWLVYRDHWCDGNPSQTIYYSDNEYFAIAQWVWDHWDSIGGLSFFPRADGESVYENAPYEEITEDQYKQATEGFPSIAWDTFVEAEDTTTGMQELSCSGGQCEL